MPYLEPIPGSRFLEKGTNVNHELDVQTIFHDRDPVTNTVKVTLKVPKTVDPKIAKAIFLEAIKNMQEDYR